MGCGNYLRHLLSTPHSFLPPPLHGALPNTGARGFGELSRRMGCSNYVGISAGTVVQGSPWAYRHRLSCGRATRLSFPCVRDFPASLVTSWTGNIAGNCGGPCCCPLTGEPACGQWKGPAMRTLVAVHSTSGRKRRMKASVGISYAWRAWRGGRRRSGPSLVAVFSTVHFDILYGILGRYFAFGRFSRWLNVVSAFRLSHAFCGEHARTCLRTFGWKNLYTPLTLSAALLRDISLHAPGARAHVSMNSLRPLPIYR